jgi:hypothetical protein
LLDPDGDGYSNLQEYLLGMSPLVSNLPLTSDIVVTHTFLNDSVIWIATSSNASTFVIYKNGVFETGGIWISGVNISFDIANFLPATYNLTLVVTDELEKSISHSVILTIPDPPVPQTTTETITNTISVPTTTTEITEITVPDTTTNTEIVTNTATEIETTIKTTFSTIISQIVESITKTSEGFTIAFIAIGLLGVVIIKRRRQE